MLQRIHSSRTILALLMVAATVTIGAGTSESSGAAPEEAAGSVLAKEKASEIPQQANNDRNRKKIRQENDMTSKAGEPLYPQQAEWLAKHYRETAAIVARQGGDPQPLLDAAVYFERQSKK